MSKGDIKKKAIHLRKQGKTYQEIVTVLSKAIPKGTMSGWFRGLQLSHSAKLRLEKRFQKHLNRARVAAKAVNEGLRQEYLGGIRRRNEWVRSSIREKETAKIALAMLYLGEGKKQGGSISFGNSNPETVLTFLGLLRSLYPIDEKKFRVTVQCRADQSSSRLLQYWSELTGIPTDQFYRTRVDKRSIGAPTKKKGYKGVCRIDYFSADLFNELRIIAEMVAGVMSMGR